MAYCTKLCTQHLEHHILSNVSSFNIVDVVIALLKKNHRKSIVMGEIMSFHAILISKLLVLNSDYTMKVPNRVHMVEQKCGLLKFAHGLVLFHFEFNA